MVAGPVVPRNEALPLGTPEDRLESAAIADFQKRIRACSKLYKDLVKSIDFEKYTTNAVRYEFRTLPDVLMQMLQHTSDLVDSIMLEGGLQNLWFLQYVQRSLETGTAAAWTNIGVQSTAYKVSRPTLQSVFMSEPYQRRLGLVRAREFEEMKGLTATLKQQLAGTLTRGLAQGIGPLEIARNVTAQTGIEERRAVRIARTEIPTALRTARLDETNDAVQRLEIKMMVMHLSALSPTTRPLHAARHGTLHTVQEQRDWMAEDGNSINCKCSQTEVLVDDKGKPYAQKAIDKARAARERFEAAQDG